MKKLVIIASVLLVTGCSDTIVKEDLKHLNGYWEIEQVVFPDGNTKAYGVNTSIDYLQLEGLKGFRKKVQPKLDGTYETSDDAEAFVIGAIDNGFVVNYKTELSEWSEKLVELSSKTFSVVNEEGIRYDYKRFEGFDL